MEALDTFVVNSRIGRDLMTIRRLYNDLERMRDVKDKTRQRNSIRARIAELSRGLPRFFEDRPNPVPLPLETVNTLLETYGPYANESSLLRPRPRPQQQPRRTTGGGRVPEGFVDFNIGEDRKKLVGKIVRVNQDGHKYRGIVTDMTVSGAQVQSTSDNRIRIVHPSKLTIVGSAFTPDSAGAETSRSVSSDHFERARPNFTSPTPAGFVMSREDELSPEDKAGHSRFMELENTVQDILVIVKRSVPTKVSLPFANSVAHAILPELTVVQTNLKISYAYTLNLFKALVAAFVHLYLEPRTPTGFIDIPSLMTNSGYIPSIEQRGKSVSARELVARFIDLLRGKYSVDFPIVDTQTISYIGRAKGRRYVQFGQTLGGDDTTKRVPTQFTRSVLPDTIHFGDSLGTGTVASLFELTPQEQKDLRALESREEQLIDRLQQKQSDPLYKRIHFLKTSDSPMTGGGIGSNSLAQTNARLDEIAVELVKFSQERERKLAGEIKRGRDINAEIEALEKQHDDILQEQPRSATIDEQIQIINEQIDELKKSFPDYIRTKRNLLYKEKASLMAKRTKEMKKSKASVSSGVSEDEMNALREQRRSATTDAQKQIIDKQIRDLKTVKMSDSLVDEEIAQLEARLVRKYGNPEIMLNRLQKLRRLRELRAKARETMGALFE